VTTPETQGGQKGALRLRSVPLDRALKELAKWSGANIVLDPHAMHEGNAPRKSLPGLPGGAPAAPPPDSLVTKTPVSATFKSGPPPASAARVLAALAGLDAVALDGVVFVTTHEVAERMRDGLLKEQTAKGVAPK